VKRKGRLKEILRNGGICAAATILFGVLVLQTRLGDGFRHLSYDLPFLVLPGGDISNENAIIVFMDEQSTKELHQDPIPGAWSHDVHTKLLKVLKEQGADLAVFDVLFDTPSKDTNIDLALVQAMNANRKVVVAAQLQNVEGMGKQPVLPLEGIRSAVPFGIADFVPDTDNVVRMHYYPKEIPGMALKVAELLGHYPTNDFRDRWIKYYRPIPFMSYYQALEPLLPTNFFTGKKVFIGKTPHTDAGGTKYEKLATPLGDMQAVEVLATTCLNFLRGDWITEMSLPA